ncbi:t-SNARE [Jimgerdemannia flammicorona]|uniref:t-SNARE n=1 Tax=Jimgerdemannia flammicorona TaxID=994334 RepID=A0A433DMF9_9FUNG|nr:t-SNARE [Jimgerdemannia flammicorona]
MNSIKDRTQEFHSAVESIRSRSHQTALERRSLLATPPPGSKKHSALSSKSEFAQMAGQIGKEINIVAAKLEKLTKPYASQSSLVVYEFEILAQMFLHYPISHLLNPPGTHIYHQARHREAEQADRTATGLRADDQGSVETSVGALVQCRRVAPEQTCDHIHEFQGCVGDKDPASKDRREQFMFSTAEQSTRPTISTSSPTDYIPTAASELHHRPNSPLLNTDRRAVNSNLMSPASPTDDDSTLGLGIPMLTPGQQQAQMMVMQQEQYIESRSTAIESIESTIAELGNIFQQLAQMVAEQREQVQRIDQNTDDIEMNVTGAQKELQKYFNNISSNRWLMMKIFATIVFFALVMAAMS